MATPAQQAANAANARKSTGPRTIAGKVASARNATTHGLTARELVIRPDERQIYEDLIAAHRADLKPEGALQETVFAQLIAAAWNLRRVRILQCELFDGSLDPLADPGLDARCDRLARYEQRFERTLYRAIAELRRLQTALAAVELTVDEGCAAAWSPLTDIRHVLSAKRSRSRIALEEARLTIAAIEAQAAQLPAMPLGHSNAA